VPGIAFDRAGGRLGRGAGFYDRGLTRVDRRAVVFGVCFALQFVVRVPRETHDRGVEGVFCEHGLIAPSTGDRPLDPG
jgi:5-formyltetrahydrofolate cyclo-ligase